MRGGLRAKSAAAIAWCALFASLAAAAAGTNESVSVAGRTRTFALHIPAGEPPRDGFPVVLAFHGGGMQGADMRRITRLDDVADRRRFITIYPDGAGKHWNDGRSTITNPQDDVRFVSTLLDKVEEAYAVDRKRVFATGISNGALFAERLGCELSGRIAGIAPVAGTMPVEMLAACRPAEKVAVLQIDGTADPIMPYAGGTVEDFGGRGEGGRVASVAQTAAFWARNNGCDAAGEPARLAPATALDPTRVIRRRYRSCPSAAPVTVLTVAGGGHAWPGGAQAPRPRIIGRISHQIDASEVVANFFLALPPR